MTASTPSVAPSPRGVLRHYWRVAGVRWWHFALPVALVLISGAFEAASFSLLIPLTNAVSDNSFDFLQSSRAFGWILRILPDSLASSPSRDAILVVVTVGLIIVGRVGKLLFDYLRKLYVVARTERYRVSVGEETFGRVLSFGRQYFDGQSIGRIDAEIGWSSSVLGLLSAAEELFTYVVGLIAKAGVMVAISLPLSIAFIVTLPFVQWFMTHDQQDRHPHRGGRRGDRPARTLPDPRHPGVDPPGQGVLAGEDRLGQLHRGAAGGRGRRGAPRPCGEPQVPRRGSRHPPGHAARPGYGHLPRRRLPARGAGVVRRIPPDPPAGASRLQVRQHVQREDRRGDGRAWTRWRGSSPTRASSSSLRAPASSSAWSAPST